MPISELVSVYSECSIVSMARSVKVKGNQLRRITPYCQAFSKARISPRRPSFYHKYLESAFPLP